MLQRRWLAPWPLDVRAILGPLQQGSSDPCLRFYRHADEQAAWWAVPTCDGPATVWVRVTGTDVRSTAWGPGAASALDRLPFMLGSADDAAGFDLSRLLDSATHPELRRRAAGWAARWRVPASGDVVSGLVTAVLGQRVTGGEAHVAWRALVTQFGSRAAATPHAPVGAPSLWMPPTPEEWLRVPSWAWHAAGVDGHRSDTIMRALRCLSGIDVWATPAPDLRRRLRAIPGIGVWTDAVVAAQVFGDADAVPFRDVHVCHDVGYALTGSARSSDVQLRDLLEPWRGHRFRVVRLSQLCRVSAPRFGPRYAPIDIASM